MSQKGFTLVDAMVSVAVVGILAGPQVIATFGAPGLGMDRNYNGSKVLYGYGGDGGGWG